MFVSKYLYAEEDEGNYMLPKAQPGRTFFKNFFRYRLNGFKTDFPDKKTKQNTFCICECLSQSECKRATAIKTPCLLLSKINPVC